MPLVLIKEDGTGKPDSNSYATLAEAADYHAASAIGATWGALNDSERSALLVRATRLIDALCRFPGMRLTATQRLQWPRGGAIMDGWAVPANAVPRQLVEATAELAAVLKESGDVTAPDEVEKLSSVKVGDIQIDFRAPGNYANPTEKLRSLLPSNVFALLLPILGNPGPPDIRLIRA